MSKEIIESSWGKLTKVSDFRLCHMKEHYKNIMYSYGSCSSTPDEFLAVLHDDYMIIEEEIEKRKNGNLQLP